jgi:hypothetical protein
MVSVPGSFVYTPATGSELAAGNQTLLATFTPTDSTTYTTATDTITLAVEPATPTVTWATPAGITYGTALSATQLDATASVSGTFTYTQPAGTVVSAGTQTLSVTFTPTDATGYASVIQTTTINVGQATPNISWQSPAAITYGTALGGTQLDASAPWMVGGAVATVAGTFEYSPQAGAVFSPSAEPETLSVTFTPADTTDYTTVTQTTIIDVNQATPTISWSPAAITYGTALGSMQLDATANVPGTFTYSAATGTVLSAGNNMLSMTFTPTDATDYATVTQTATIDVSQATPTISWPAPAAITYGTALGGTQLDASASWIVAGTLTTVPGIFTYAQAGTVLKAGSGQTLSVTFTPTDTTDYATPAAQTTTIDVNQATPTINWPAQTITYGTALSSTQLDAAASWTVGGVATIVAGTPTYTPATGTVLSAGSGQTLSVTFAPTDTTDYTTVTQTTSIDVLKATPNIVWPAQVPIAQGTPLTGLMSPYPWLRLELAASANWTVNGTTGAVAGSFVYTPKAGTVLPAGDRTLSTTFTPTDTNDYNVTTFSIPIIVVGPVSLSQSTLAVSQTPLAPGGKTTVTLTAMDANGNHELGGGLKVAFKVSGSGGCKIGAVTDHKNGTYTATFTAGAKAGPYTITATVGGKSVTASTPITVTVAGKAASSSAATPASLSLGKGPANGVTTDAALRRLLLDDSAVTGKPRPLFEP